MSGTGSEATTGSGGRTAESGDLADLIKVGNGRLAEDLKAGWSLTPTHTFCISSTQAIRRHFFVSFSSKQAYSHPRRSLSSPAPYLLTFNTPLLVPLSPQRQRPQSVRIPAPKSWPATKISPNRPPTLRRSALRCLRSSSTMGPKMPYHLPSQQRQHVRLASLCYRRPLLSLSGLYSARLSSFTTIICTTHYSLSSQSSSSLGT